MARIWSEAAIAASIAEAERAHEATEAARERFLGASYKRRERVYDGSGVPADFKWAKYAGFYCVRGGQGRKRHGSAAPFVARNAY